MAATRVVCKQQVGRWASPCFFSGIFCLLCSDYLYEEGPLGPTFLICGFVCYPHSRIDTIDIA